MWFLWFYLISLFLCILILIISVKATRARIKRECPQVLQKVKKRTKVEAVRATIPYFIPFINIILIFIMIMDFENIYLDVVKKYKKEINTKNKIEEDDRVEIEK